MLDALYADLASEPPPPPHLVSTAAPPAFGPGAELADADLRGADMVGADLRGAVLHRADLRDAQLAGADLTDAQLFAAQLDGADLTGATLDRAMLEEISAERTGFTGASLREAKLSRAQLAHASLGGADLRGADLRGVDGHDARLTGCDLRGADLTGAKLRDCDLCDIRVDDGCWDKADLRGAALTGITGYASAHWIGADIRNIAPLGVQRWKRFVADQNYLEELRRGSRLDQFLYRVWWLTSDCGRSMVRWALCNLVLVVVFGLIYSHVAVDYGAHPTWLSPYYFSVVTMTTLGFGDVLPASAGAQAIVMLEVACGYLMLGGLLSILSNKIARRAD